jgi:fructokinase
MKNYFAGIESGGTKFNILIANSPDDILAETTIPTETPENTLRQVSSFIKKVIGDCQCTLLGVGIGAFGPLDLNPKSRTYGQILSTPKSGWIHIDILHQIQASLRVPVFIDTDVNCAALGEGKWGAAKGISNFIYITIGTGIGGGVIINGQPLHGLMHPELGHIFIPHNRADDPFLGNCPFHADCFEGLASGPAIEKRWGKPGTNLPVDHSGWELEAKYIALAISNYILTLSPERIILGGGVMQQKHLFPLIHLEVVRLLNNYVPTDLILSNIKQFIVPPALGNCSGSLGAIALTIKSS